MRLDDAPPAQALQNHAVEKALLGVASPALF